MRPQEGKEIPIWTGQHPGKLAWGRSFFCHPAVFLFHVLEGGLHTTDYSFGRQFAHREPLLARFEMSEWVCKSSANDDGRSVLWIPVKRIGWPEEDKFRPLERGGDVGRCRIDTDK